MGTSLWREWRLETTFIVYLVALGVDLKAYEHFPRCSLMSQKEDLQMERKAFSSIDYN